VNFFSIRLPAELKSTNNILDPTFRFLGTYYFNHKKDKWYTDEGIKQVLSSFTAIDSYQTRYLLNNHRNLRQKFPLGGVGTLTKAHLCEAARLVDSVVDEVGFTSDLDAFMERLQKQLGLPVSVESRFYSS
jgi:hypothetical protein